MTTEYALTQARSGGGTLRRQWHLTMTKEGEVAVVIATFSERNHAILCASLLNAINAATEVTDEQATGS